MTQAMPEANKITVPCHVPDMPVDENGIKDYYWPVSNQERRGFSDFLAKSYADVIRNAQSDDMIPYQLFGIHFIVQVIAVFQGDLLRERAKVDGVDLQVPADWPYWPALLEEETPEAPELLAMLQNGPEKTSYGKKLFRLSSLRKLAKVLNLKKAGLEVDGLKVKAISDDVLKNNIIATQRSGLILQHAVEVGQDVVFCRSNRWFRHVSDEKLSSSIQRNNKIFEKKILDVIAEGYRHYGIELKAHSQSFVQNLLDKGPAVLRIHYERLNEKPDSLPREIWSGTAGHIWDMILRVAVMKNGGKAVGHDHGSGCAYALYPLRGITEFWGCQEYVTFNQNHAQEMAKDAEFYPRYDDQLPAMISVKPSGNIKKVRDVYKKPKTVFIMATLYDNDRGRPGPGNVNNFLVDWQVRLASFLKQSGYDVVIKIHPETKIMPPDFLANMGVQVTKEPFTDIMSEADVILFDCIFTTAFTDTMATNIPAVLIDFFDFPWTERGKDLIGKRCEIVKAGYEGNRAAPDWAAIDQAIQQVPQKCENHDFYRTYFL